MGDLISVIVPVYNVEKYLEKCVESICLQTYMHLEIILVDDGSTDRSGSICDALAVTDKRITVIHKENGGLSDARNAGMNAANGTFICFFDSDDWVEADTLQKAYMAIRQSGADVAIWGFSKDFVDTQECVVRSEVLRKPAAVCNRARKDYNMLADDTSLAMIGYAWNKLYRRCVLVRNQLEFDRGISLVEDMLFNSRALVAANAMVFVDNVGTHYIQRKRETLGAKFYPDYFELKLRACRARESLLKAYGASEDIAFGIIEKYYFTAVKSSCRMACTTISLTDKEKMKYIRELCGKSEVAKIVKEYKATNKDIIIKYLVGLKCASAIKFLYSR